MSHDDSSIPAGSRLIEKVPDYRVCDGGAVWSSFIPGGQGRKGPWHLLTPLGPGEHGYFHYRLAIGGGRYWQPTAHQLVMEAFRGPCPPGKEVCHKDGNPANNYVKNLRYGTPKRNAADRRIHGRDTIGEKHGNAKLKDSDIPEIFRLYSRGFTANEIAQIYGVTSTPIYLILNRKAWKHVAVDVLPGDHRKTAKGERHAKAILTEGDIPEIFRLSKEGLSKPKIAKLFGVSPSTIASILSRRNWSHVPIENPPEIRRKTYAFVSPSGEVYRDIAVLKVFCESHDLSAKMMGYVDLGRVQSHRGWTKPINLPPPT
jgi:transcriptional regulator